MPQTSVSYANSLNDTNVSSVKEEPLPSPADETTFKPWRVFINHIDSYHGKALVDVSLTIRLMPEADVLLSTLWRSVIMFRCSAGL